jgi:hypothetical protein
MEPSSAHASADLDFVHNLNCAFPEGSRLIGVSDAEGRRVRQLQFKRLTRWPWHNVAEPHDCLADLANNLIRNERGLSESVRYWS